MVLATIKWNGASLPDGPKHLSQTDFDRLPETMIVREVSLRLTRKGWRDQFIIVVTTLLDAKIYSAHALTELYGYRWRAAEVNLRHLKTTLKNGDDHGQNPCDGAQRVLGSLTRL